MMLATACAAALVLSACGGKSGNEGEQAAMEGVPAPAAPATADPTPVAVDGTGGDALLDRGNHPIALVPFDIGSVPVSTQALGELPVFSLPTGYAPANYAPANGEQKRAYARFPFRVGDGLHWVEGASWSARIGIDRQTAPDKEYSALELRRNLEAVLEQAGAKKIFEGPLKRDLYYGPQLEDEIGGGFIDGVNMDGDTPTTVHVVRQADRNIWVQLSADTMSAGLVIVEERPFVATSHWKNEFPYLSLPAGYDDGNRPRQRDYDAYPFWTGSGFETVEGKTHAASVKAREGLHSMHEVRRNLEAMMAEAGGTKLFDGRIPKDAADSITFEQKSPYSDATSFGWGDYDSLVYRVDLPDGRQVWVHARSEYLAAGWVVVERQGFAQTSALLPADALKKQLDASGRVAIQVNFATDKADILPESQPQIDQVLALLRQDPALSLSIEGHTDDTGTVERNRTLSTARAASVVAALTGQGIDAQRLSAAGFGQDRPIADNGTDAGRAKNRRVELVRKP
ncbi:OmpA family protein [Pseudoxanthomonas putridarboris]|uniref:OmpA family protein n=1 Tax=Pseudoxanthomonas putridarboris TaxID=752605 RepID=A0ABU9IWY8_9GAMM